MEGTASEKVRYYKSTWFQMVEKTSLWVKWGEVSNMEGLECQGHRCGRGAGRHGEPLEKQQEEEAFFKSLSLLTYLIFFF